MTFVTYGMHSGPNLMQPHRCTVCQAVIYFLMLIETVSKIINFSDQFVRHVECCLRISKIMQKCSRAEIQV